MPQENYHERQAEKQERYAELANKHVRQAEQMFKQARDMAECIPLGQPILVGHHSEQRDRNFRKRIDRTYERSFEENDKAKHYAEKAARIDNPKAISSDNPDAIQLLEEKLSKLETWRDKGKEINKVVKSKKKNYDIEARINDLIVLGLKETTARKLFEPDYMGRIGIPAYEFTNTGAEIRRIKARIETLKADLSTPTAEKMIGEIRFVDSAEENRIQLFYPGKPDEATRKKLKSYGFRWSPRNGCWQGFRNNNARYYGEKIAQGAI